MIASLRQPVLLACLLIGGIFPGGMAEEIAPAPPEFAKTNRPASPPLPVLKSPVEMFRELLAMSLRDRKQFLTNRTAEAQKAILAKVREYESLKPDEREFRLQATELHWYLLPLMNLAPTNRAARLASIPERQRKLVEDRLQQWDLLPPETRQELLSNEQAAGYFAQLEAAGSEEQRQKILSQVSPERRARLQAGIDRWRGLSETQRRQTLDQFNAFFELTPREKDQALNILSDSERRQMEKVLQAYAELTPDQRAHCLRSFGKFAGMSVAERVQFLKNADRWKRLTPAERAAWRNLVSTAPLTPLTHVPPAPPNIVPRRPLSAAMATN